MHHQGRRCHHISTQPSHSLLLQIVGVIFPVLIIALVPIRQFIFPLIFSDQTLYHLDPAPYEAVPAGVTRPRN